MTSLGSILRRYAGRRAELARVAGELSYARVLSTTPSVDFETTTKTRYSSGWGSAAGPPARRFFSSQDEGGVGSSSPTNVAAKALLRSLRAVDFLPHLMELKKSKRVMAMEDLEIEFHKALPLASDEDGRRILAALADSGLVLKAGDVVYLEPEEIAQTVRRVLPVDMPLIKKRLEEVEREVLPMIELREGLEAKARRKNALVNAAFLGFLSLQWGVFLRLCYWELSWDVVEPLGFFAGGLTTVIGFGWAVWTRRDFSYEALNGEFRNRWVDKELERQGFDFLAYERLVRERTRLRESLKLSAVG
jgi:hypothetical protein